MANVAEFNIDFTDLKVLHDHLNKAEGKVELLATSAKKDFKKLQLAIDPVKRATKAFTDQVLVAQKALVTGQASQKEYAQVFKQIQANANAAGLTINQFGQVADVNTRKMKRFGAVGMQQVGYQVQDFAVQVQGGTSVLVALGQQGSQLLGIFGPAGAIAGMILAIGTGLAGAFMAARDASSSATATVLSYGEALKLAREKTQELTDANAFLLSGMRSIEEFQITQAIRKLEESKELKAEIMTATGNISSEDATEYVNKKVDKKIADLKAMLALLSEGLDTSEGIENDKDRDELRENLDRRLAALAKEQSLRYGMAQLSEREALIYKQQTEMAQELLTLKKLGLAVGSVEEKHVIKMIQARHDEELATYDLKKAEEALEEQRKLDAENQRARAARLKEELKQALKDNADVLKSSKAIGSAMEDAMMSMVDGTKSVKDAFKDMASAIIKDLYRIYVVKKITGMITGAIDAKFAPGVGEAQAAVAGAVANGGPVQAGQRYVVGERGPEMFTPNVSGTITPNSQMGGNGVTVVQNINISTGVQQTVRAEIRQMMPQIAQSAKSAVVDSKRRGGNYGRAMA